MNLRPSGYEPDELPDCSIPRQLTLLKYYMCIIALYSSILNLSTFLTFFNPSSISHFFQSLKLIPQLCLVMACPYRIITKTIYQLLWLKKVFYKKFRNIIQNIDKNITKYVKISGEIIDVSNRQQGF